jgi:hypothetical protein
LEKLKLVNCCFQGLDAYCLLEVFGHIQKRLESLNIKPDYHKFLGKKAKNTNTKLLSEVNKDNEKPSGSSVADSTKLEVNIFNVGLSVLAYGFLVYFIETKLFK